MMIAEEGLLSCVHNLSQKIADAEYTEMDLKTFKTFTTDTNRMPENASADDV